MEDHLKQPQLETPRLILRAWQEEDAAQLYRYAQDERVGPAAAWPVHTSVENSRQIIRDVLAVPESYAIVLKETGEPVGSIGLMMGKNANLDILDSEAEIGYWIGVPYWGQGLVPEAATVLIQRAFEELDIGVIWCGYFEGNEKSRRVQEKCGFEYSHTLKEVLRPLLGDTKTEHVSCLTKEAWLQQIKENN